MSPDNCNAQLKEKEIAVEVGENVDHLPSNVEPIEGQTMDHHEHHDGAEVEIKEKGIMEIFEGPSFISSQAVEISRQYS